MLKNVLKTLQISYRQRIYITCTPKKTQLIMLAEVYPPKNWQIAVYGSQDLRGYKKTTLPSSTVHISPEINAESFLTQDSKEKIGDNVFDLTEATHLSSLKRLKNVVARMLKWKTYKRNSSMTLNEEDIKKGRMAIEKNHQMVRLRETRNRLLNGKIPDKNSFTHKLSPFIDNEGLIRVGGRLGNANIPYEQKHPTLIAKGKLADLMIREAHINHLHAGNMLTQQMLGENYYIQGVKNSIKHCIRQCPKCIRYKAVKAQQEMGQLPSSRVMATKAFSRTGVDLAGPFFCKASHIKFDKIIKVWLVVFVCMYTKAAHLEYVTNLSTEDFLAAFTRFSSRRGKVNELYSDNGTNFIGAHNLLKSTYKTLMEKCKEKLALKEIKWTHTPRHSPHFGALHESLVKSVKYFIKRAGATRNFTPDQFQSCVKLRVC
jgi:Integrase zinc binding domain